MDGRRVISLAFAALSAAGCISPASENDIGVAEAKGLVEANKGNTDFVVLDVRTSGEYAEGHIEGAILLDFEAGDFRRKADMLPRGRTYLVYCRSGRRSAEAVKALSEMGFGSLWNMAGGFDVWKTQGYPTVA